MFLHLIGGDTQAPAIPSMSPDQEQRDGELSNAVQRAVSNHSIAQRAIREGNGRVINLLNEALGGHAH